MEETTVTEYLNTDYRDFAIYTIEHRAIPGVDGFKPVQRKIWFSAEKHFHGSNSPLKVTQFSGRVSTDTMYLHGNDPLDKAIINMAQGFKNNLPLFFGVGQFGTLRNPENGAPRYISVKLSEGGKYLFKDSNLLEYKTEEGQSIEPKYFLPLIPLMLVNGSSGTAVGFATDILNRNIKEIIKYCITYLKSGKLNEPEIQPYFTDFTGTFQKIENEKEKNTWIARGKYEVINTTTVKITELPPSMTYEKYEKHLNTLVDKGIIYDYEDNCRNNIEYIIKITRTELVKYQEDNNKLLEKHLKINESFTENLTILDEFNKIKIFKTTNDIIRYFIDFRLSFFAKRKEFLINKLEYDILVLKNKIKFINYILNEKIVFKGKSQIQIEEKLEFFKFDKIENSYSYLLNMRILSFVKELEQELFENLTKKEAELQETKITDPKTMYINDLKELSKNVG